MPQKAKKTEMTKIDENIFQRSTVKYSQYKIFISDHKNNSKGFLNNHHLYCKGQ